LTCSQAERSGLSLANQNYLPPGQSRPYEDLVRYRFQPNHNGGRQLTHPHLFKRSASPDTPVLLSPEPSPLHGRRDSSPDSLTDGEAQRHQKLPSPAAFSSGAAVLDHSAPGWEGGGGGRRPLLHPLQPPEPCSAGGGPPKTYPAGSYAPPPSNGLREVTQQEQRHSERLTMVKTTNRVESHYYTASTSTRSRGNPVNQISSSGVNKLTETSNRSNNSNNNNNNNNEERNSGEWAKKYKGGSQQQSPGNSNSWDSTCAESASSLNDHTVYAVNKRTNADSGASHAKAVLTNHRAAPHPADSSNPVLPRDRSQPSRETGAIPKQRRRQPSSPVPHPDEIISLPLDDPLLSSSKIGGAGVTLAANSTRHSNAHHNFAR
jgi:hypothetical protein